MNLTKVKVLSVVDLTHDTKSFRLEKPQGYIFGAGQALYMSIPKSELEGMKRPYSLASKPSDDFIELIIKSYPERESFSNAVHDLGVGDEVFISGPFGLLNVPGEGSAVFVASGSAITKFLSLLRTLKEGGEVNDHVLIYSNKTSEDIILADELRSIFSEHPQNLVLVLTRDSGEGYLTGRVNSELLSKYSHDESGSARKFLAAGSNEFVRDILGIVKELGGV